LRAVDEHRHAGLLAKLPYRQHATGRPEHLREREQPRPWRHRRHERLRLGVRDDDAGAARVDRPEQAEVLLPRRHDLVLRAEVEPREDDVAPVRRRARQRDEIGRRAHERPERRAGLLAEREHPLEELLPEPAVLELVVELRLHCVRGGPGDRAEGPGVQIREPVEHREERACFGGCHETVTSTGAWSESTAPS
jgi:hypothetical protein